MYAAPTLWNNLDLDIRLLPFDSVKIKTHLYLEKCVNRFLLSIDSQCHTKKIKVK